jgi:hypothetical protein
MQGTTGVRKGRIGMRELDVETSEKGRGTEMTIEVNFSWTEILVIQ